MASRRFRKAALAAWIVMVCVCFAASGIVHAKKKGKVKRYGLLNFELSIEESNGGTRIGGAGYQVELTHSGKSLFKEESYGAVPDVKVLSNTPSKDCKGMLAMLFSGGAHCCFTAILATACQRAETAVVLDLQDGGTVEFIDANGDGTKEISFLDMQFGYYDSEVSDLGFPFATSPAMHRLLVFEKNGWRVDKPGEHEEFYSKLMLKSKAATERELAARRWKQGDPTDDEPAAASAMETTYYALMAGEAESGAKELLQNLLPPRWQDAREKIFSDIKEKIKELSPVVGQLACKAGEG